MTSVTSDCFSVYDFLYSSHFTDFFLFITVVIVNYQQSALCAVYTERDMWNNANGEKGDDKIKIIYAKIKRIRIYKKHKYT